MTFYKTRESIPGFHTECVFDIAIGDTVLLPDHEFSNQHDGNEFSEYVVVAMIRTLQRIEFEFESVRDPDVIFDMTFHDTAVLHVLNSPELNLDDDECVLLSSYALGLPVHPSPDGKHDLFSTDESNRLAFIRWLYENGEFNGDN